jgi:hypothetical protein
MKHLTFSNVVALLALFVALGGTAWALANNSVKSRHIDNGQVKTEDLDGDAVTGGKIEADAVKASDVADEGLTGAEIADGALTGADIANSGLTGGDIADGTLTGGDIAADTLTGSDVNEATLTAGGQLTGSLANAALDDEVVDAEALAELPSARLELPRDSSNCAASVSVPASTVVDVPWLVADEGGGLAPLPECATDVIVPIGGFYLTTVRIQWNATGGASQLTTEIARAGGTVASDTTQASGVGTTQTVAMATSVAAGAALTARVSHDGNANATLLGVGEMVVYYLGP